MTSATYQPHRSAAGGLWVAALFAVLAGLFGMHGLGGHGTGDLAGSSVTAPVTHAANPGGHATIAASPPLVTSVGLSTGLSGAGSPMGSMPGGMAGMCLVVLSVVILALLWFLRTSPSMGVLWVTSRLRVTPVGVGRTLDPPSLAQLSILRC
ncbi:MAG: DUF6153 family protein [Marmoricola sp.]